MVITQIPSKKHLYFYKFNRSSKINHVQIFHIAQGLYRSIGRLFQHINVFCTNLLRRLFADRIFLGGGFLIQPIRMVVSLPF